jgi:hypothetical protein
VSLMDNSSTYPGIKVFISHRKYLKNMNLWLKYKWNKICPSYHDILSSILIKCSDDRWTGFSGMPFLAASVWVSTVVAKLLNSTQQESTDGHRGNKFFFSWLFWKCGHLSEDVCCR